jgi:hypothetical protein
MPSKTTQRLSRRWLHRELERVGADVIEFKPRVRGPSVKIHGRDYARSTYGGPLGDMLEDPGSEQTSGARLIKVKPHDPWRFLWVLDTDRKLVTMWRISDGSEKVSAPASTHTHEIVMLEKRGQLNRVNHSEFDQIDRFMLQQYDTQLAALKQYLAEQASDEEKKLPPLLQEYFKKAIAPEFVKRMKRWESGAHPLGFKPLQNSGLGPKRQLASWTINEVMKTLWTLDKVESFLKNRGVELGLLGNQDVYFAMSDVWYDLADSILGPYHDKT